MSRFNHFTPNLVHAFIKPPFILLVVCATVLYLISPMQDKVKATQSSISSGTVTLYDNGPFVNSIGTGVGNANESIMQSTTLGLDTLGFGAHLAAGVRLADDFTVTGTAWQLNTVHLYAYQTDSSTTSTITAVNLRIWNGPPGTSGASVIFGDTSTNRLLSTNWTGAYRVSETTSGSNTQRPIMRIVANLGGVTLPAGTYWLDWQLDGSLASGPWAPPITITGQTITGNARQYLSGNWGLVTDSGLGTTQDFPFLLLGEPTIPAHDLFSNARIINNLPYQNVDHTHNATRSSDDPIFPCGSGNQGNRSVWYRYTPTTTANLIAYTYTSSYDTMLAVWTGTPGNLTNIACNDDHGSPNWSLQSEVTFKAHAGTTYYLQIASYGQTGPGGNLIFNVREADKWTAAGPERPSPSVNALAIVPQSPNTILAATREGVFKSTNGGSTWVAKRNGLSTFGGLEVTDITVDPTNSNYIYLSTWGDGVYRSTDNGENWSRVSDPLSPTALQQSGLLQDGQEYRVGGSAFLPPSPAPKTQFDKPDLSAPLNDEATTLLKSSPVLNTGSIDSSILSPDPIGWTPARTVAIHPTNNNRLIVGISGWGFYLTQNARANNVTWTAVNMPGGTLTSGRAIAFSPSNPNIAYASLGDWGDNGGIFRSSDGGLSWSLVAGNEDINSVVTQFAIDPNNSNHVLAATYGNGIMRTTNGGANWSPSNIGLSDNFIINIAISSANPNLVYALSFWDVWQSNDGGDSWGFLTTETDNINNQAIALHPTNSSVAYVGTYQSYSTFGYLNSGIYKTTNGGSSFTPQLNGLSDTYVLDVVVDPNDPNIVYAATWGSGIFRSNDGGITWDQANTGLWLPFVYTLEAVAGPAGTVLYAGTFYSNAALFVSHNQGLGWTHLPPGILPGFARNIFDISSSDGSSHNLVIATGDGLYTTFNGGQDWQRSLINGNDTENIVVSVTRVNGISDRMVAATYGDGVYYSHNSGYDWNKASGLASSYIFGLSAGTGSSTEVYAAHAGVSTGGQAISGIARSTNGGISWNQVTRGLPIGVSFRTVAHSSGNSNHIYGGSIGQGMWVKPATSDMWFPFSHNFTPTRVRMVQADVTNPMRVFASTDGEGIWVLTPDQKPYFGQTYLPIVLR